MEKMNTQIEIVCAIFLILLIVLVPKYIKLPHSLELLLHDTIGQILLLLIAVFVGAHNLLCGVLLVIFIVSIMLQTTEGFDVEKKNKKSTQTPEPTPSEEESTSEPEKESQIKTYQTAINSLQSKINELETKETSKPTKSSEMTEYKETKKANNKKMVTTKTKQTKEPFEDEDEQDQEEENIEEGFSCGCDSNSTQVKKIKYDESQNIDESLKGLFEKFENPGPSVKTPNPFDVVGCRFDMKESNPLHETIYGAPVDSCQAYSTANTGTGTVFYPLNAF
jgi:hypothetical protein